MMYEYDVIVIGSGFGGAITAYKLAKKGYRVCILERGPQWTGEYFPGSTERGPMENLKDIICAARLNLYGVPIPIREILKKADWFNVTEKWAKPALWEYRVLGRMDVLTASGVGGGSLVYANVLHRARRDTFAEWPKSVDWFTELQGHYAEVEGTIGTTTAKDVAGDAKFDKARALRKAAESTGGAKWGLVNLAINKVHPNLSKLPGLTCKDCHAGDVPPEEKGDCETENEELHCMACGRCVLGCKRQNKHTLDLNYIKDAVALGAHLYPNHEVSKIIPLDETSFNYRVLCDKQKRAFQAKRVVVAAGSVGSAKLLLQCKDDSESLPRLSERLGWRFSGNGDFQGFAHKCNEPVNSSIGPTITSEVDFNAVNKPLVVEEGGIPSVLGELAQAAIPSLGVLKQLKEFELIDLIMGKKELVFDKEDVTKNTLMYLCMERIDAYGKIELSGYGDVNIKWDEKDWEIIKNHTDNLVEELKALTSGLGGEYHSNPLWDMGKLVTVHPIGGCPMGETQEEGVVKPNGEVFGYDGLYVADGSIIPASLGVNPSLTIGALASRIAELIPAKT